MRHQERLTLRYVPASPEVWWEEVAHLWRYYFAAARASGSVADAACGTGYGSKILLDAGCEVTAYDQDEAALREASSLTKFRVPVKRVDLDEEPLSLFHTTLVCFETLEHLRDPAAFLKRLPASITTVFASVPVVPTTQVPPINQYHLHDFTIDSFGGLLDEAGFTIKETHLQSSPWRQNLYSVVWATR